ncbi:sensor histidine kinase [Parvularcula oceani]|uniref:sensor histidine kinase n=1 Tax=Parvularcula oceani TaxID=1247963 RepID=UPI000690C803|nr:ATP-binding protein [Parvularcula oceani]
MLLALAALASIVFFTTAYVLTHLTEDAPRFVPVVFALFTIVAGILASLVAGRLLDLYRSSKMGLRGAKLHGRLVGVLSLVTVIPAVVAFVLSGAVLQAFSQNYFLERVEESNLVARDLANGYFDAESRRTGLKLIQLATDLAALERAGAGPEAAPIGFRSYLLGQAVLREFAGLTLLDGDGRVVAAVSQVPEEVFALPPADVLAQLDQVNDYRFNVLDPATLDTYYAALRVESAGGGTLIAYRPEVPALSRQLIAVRDYRDETATVRERLSDLTVTFAIGYGLLLVILLLAAVLIGLLVAGNIVDPVRRLATAAGLVSEGDLTSRVEVRPRDDELGDLGRAFNDMTEQLSAQRDDLIAANDRADSRRRFIETVLSGVPAGVLNVGEDGRLVFANPSAAVILGHDRRRLAGAELGSVAPELAPLLQRARGAVDGELRDQIEVERKRGTRILNVRIVPEEPNGSGSIVLLDDITELVSAQRNAAWGDVARRIAHEIKNPLTPIQLSAERLRRRYGRQIPEEDREVFDRCTDTIVRHVGDIGRMVNEFSSFARMPAPIMDEEDLREVVREAAFPLTVAFPNVRFETRLGEEPVRALCDGRLLGQAVGNLVKNAAEAVTEQGAQGKPRITLTVRREGGEAVIAIEDNGPGLPREQRHRLTEPYMTTRAKGTGLGLAIVRKAVEDHGGRFSLGDAAGGGAAAIIVLPALDTTENDGSDGAEDAPRKEREGA